MKTTGGSEVLFKTHPKGSYIERQSQRERERDCFIKIIISIRPGRGGEPPKQPNDANNANNANDTNDANGIIKLNYIITLLYYISVIRIRITASVPIPTIVSETIGLPTAPLDRPHLERKAAQQCAMLGRR